MFYKFDLTDKLLFVAAFASLIYSEVLFFNGFENQAIFIGLWVPSILCFGIYLHLIKKNKNDWFYTLLCRDNYPAFWNCVCLCNYNYTKKRPRNEKKDWRKQKQIAFITEYFIIFCSFYRFKKSKNRDEFTALFIQLA